MSPYKSPKYYIEIAFFIPDAPDMRYTISVPCDNLQEATKDLRDKIASEYGPHTIHNGHYAYMDDMLAYRHGNWDDDAIAMPWMPLNLKWLGIELTWPHE